ncbi:hypothetical protein [Ilumatobacter sp.]|uniref:hypothetical protein n=1 Tax=Ilumatobacter sp. TaxID=1967498 RepID=UPI003C4A37D8
MRPIVLLAVLASTVIGLTGCGSDASTTDATTDTSPATGPAETTPAETGSAESAPAESEAGQQDEQMFPDVIDAEAQRSGDTWTISATLSSPYDTPERYADAWRVVDAGGTVYAERILTHDHASEQPFTRSESGIEIPDRVTEVVIEGRDLEFGYGGETFLLALPN